jgi:hypothetical protein
MAINKNHEFEELDGKKCGIVEKNVSRERAAFLQNILEFNQFEVVIVPSPPPKTSAPAATGPGDEGAGTPAPTATAAPELFTVGVTDYTFNSTNAIFGRLLKTPGGQIVTLAYWRQQEMVSNDEVPYFERT